MILYQWKLYFMQIQIIKGKKSYIEQLETNINTKCFLRKNYKNRYSGYGFWFWLYATYLLYQHSFQRNVYFFPQILYLQYLHKHHVIVLISFTYVEKCYSQWLFWTNFIHNLFVCAKQRESVRLYADWRKRKAGMHSYPNL